MVNKLSLHCHDNQKKSVGGTMKNETYRECFNLLKFFQNVKSRKKGNCIGFLDPLYCF